MNKSLLIADLQATKSLIRGIRNDVFGKFRKSVGVNAMVGEVLSYEQPQPYIVEDTEYTAGQLLKNKAIAERYTGGYALIFRLTVDDYHHYCYVADGRKSANVTLPGVFHTVNPAANDVYPIYKENAREYTLLKTKQFGTILMMEVGAMMVGKITNLHKNPATVKKGQEKGNFEFGGSTIILLTQPGKVRIDYDLIENTEEGYETIVKMGERIGECRKLKNTKNHYEGTIENT